MPITVSDREISELARRLAEVRREQQHVAGLRHATERQIDTLVEDFRRARLELGHTGFRLEALILFHLGLAAITTAIVVFHALGR